MVQETYGSDKAHARALGDLSSQTELIKLATQLLFAANGGASLAMLSFLATIATSNTLNPKLNIEAVYGGFAVAASVYLAGIVFIILSTAFHSRSKMYYGWYWEQISLSKFGDSAKRDYSNGQFWRRASQIMFAVSTSCLGVGSICALRSFF